MGVNLLRVSYGYLEWYSESSDVACHALTYDACQLIRENGTMRYALTSQQEEARGKLC